ncbi:MAG: hypothetical protein HN580_05375 [Deltaproteobacteria bacterium]|nr:hypothetical protein [Deltaproteobacteria bacterium]MBT6069031.1 hypothetical protein [Candidatus Peregrinibacteria bacterium]MBT4265692.1 hypothetical protein [Deltaproteobacteria bacterium]MBT4637701.1 hypothetical protein [Deltaproteobacteria bacterium]MBT6502228.1 hypothetical protein [Deltaproteobacteria bacterium]
MKTELTRQASLETQSEIFNRAIISKTAQIASEYRSVTGEGKTRKVDMTKSPWWFIVDERTSSDVLMPHVFEQAWEKFEQYFLQSREIFLFVEEAIVGLVSKEGKFWLFFEPETASKFFNKQQDRPKNFSSSSITKFPHLDILPALTQEIGLIIKESDKRVMAQIKKLEEVLNMSDLYLTASVSKQFVQNIKKVIQSLSLAEVRFLKQDIIKKGFSSTLLEKRLQSIYRLCMRLYVAKGEEKQENALQKLLAQQPNIRKQALNLVERRLAADVDT